METKLSADKIIETATIRLTADETRQIIKAKNGATVNYSLAQGLAGMGIMKAVPAMASVDVEARRKKLWATLQSFAAKKNLSGIAQAASELSTLDREAASKHYILTALGKQIAHNITVKLNGQYIPKK